jgi:tRNA modification GTPase
VFAPDDTIVAIATPPGRSGIGVVRVAGPLATHIAGAVLSGGPLKPRYATLRSIRESAEATNGPQLLDRVVATFFPGPHSYTGDNVVEISGHGSPVVLERILGALVRAGGRLARPGEFTLRAYANGKLDLVQAEAVGDLIEAVTPAQARLAFDQLDGTLTHAIAGIAGRIFDLRVKLEASVDFPDEGYHFIDPDAVVCEIDAARERVDTLLARAAAGRVIREGRRVMFVGAPNVGKSSLFNAFVGANRAIVTAIAGTTRDLLTERCDVEGVPVTLVDTAGLRDSDEPIEQEGVARTRGAASGASVLVFVLDRSRAVDRDERAELERFAANGQVIVAVNKCDLPTAWADEDSMWEGVRSVEVSATEGTGLAELREALLEELLGSDQVCDEIGVTNVRHVTLLEKVRTALAEARTSATDRQPEELVLADLQTAELSLDEIVGRRSADDVLEAIFARFCIGK